MEFPPILGRLHPLVLHFPIVLVPATIALEVLVWRGRVARRALTPVLVLAALAALVTAGSGWILGHEDGYGGERLERHENLGIAVAVLTALAAAVHGRAATGRRLTFYRLLLLAAGVLLVPGAHLGATLTHGVDWLRGPAPERVRREPVRPQALGPVPVEEPITEAPEAAATTPGTQPATSPPSDAADESTYAAVIAPILEARCTSCHGEAKRKGGLRLHEPEAILRGGHDGPVIVPGDPLGSLLLARARLPLDHEDHMPPEGKPQPSALELARLAAWVASGAPFEGVVDLEHVSVPTERSTPVGPPPSLDAGPAPVLDPDAPEAKGAPETKGAQLDPAIPVGLDAARVAQEPGASPAGRTGPLRAPAEEGEGPPPRFLEALASALVHVEFLQRDPPRLWIDTAAVARSLGDETLAEWLEPGLPFVAELSLARSGAGPATLKALARAPHLVRLDLRASAVHGADLEALRGHATLAELVLAQTESSGAASVLAALPALRKVFLWRSGIEGEALTWLAAERPDLELVTGGPAREGGREEGPGRGADGADWAPVNSRCPVSGNPIDPTRVVEHEGRRIAFCCGDCPALFRADPTAFPVQTP